MGFRSLIFRLTGFPSYDFMSPLPRLECAKRIRANTDRAELTFGAGARGDSFDLQAVEPGEKPLIGNVWEDYAEVHKRVAARPAFFNLQQPRYRNWLQPVLYVELFDEGSRTRLHCEVGIPAGILLLAIALIGLTLAMTVLGALKAPPWGFPATAFVICLASSTRMIWAMQRARGEQEFLVEFVRKLLDLRPAGGTP